MDTTTAQWAWGFGDAGWHRAKHVSGATLAIFVSYDDVKRAERVTARLIRTGAQDAQCTFHFVMVTTDLAKILAEARRRAEVWAETVLFLALAP